MGKISGYSFSLLLFLWTGVAFSQTDTGKTRTVDARIGFDVSKLTLFYLQPERKTFEGSLDMELFPNVYPTVELGVNTIRLKDSLFNYYSDGAYGRIGVDYNLVYPKNAGDKDMFMGGIRFGYARYTDHADSIKIIDNYWGNFNGGSLPSTAMNAEWLELLAGLKTEIVKHCFLGCSVRWRILLSKTKEDLTTPYWIPGYGSGNVKSCFGFNYSVYYAIPVYKRHFKAKVVVKEK